ncbi:MAG: thiamine-phosphate kinase, partial [Gemmatimonadota bacterium]|nr:thiamine-phosphate kinase [Gemmatimonadota bacterium]
MTGGTLPLGPGGEFDRLRAVFRHLSPRLRGVGDDAALITVDGVRLAFSCDLAVEGRHFRLEWLTATEVGWRACAAALSDLAAVAAEPLGVLAAVGVPDGLDGEFLQWLMDGIVRAAGAAGAELWGGDLVRAPQVTIDVTVVGRAERAVRRRGARPGDGLWVTGQLGAPRAAVAAWEAGLHPAPGLRERFAHPVPRIAESWWLRDHGATAMIDLSDGLVGDAGHLAAASGVRVEIAAERVPVHPAVEA